jgi:hypothetical protein
MDIIKFGAGFDWITPVASFIRTATSDHKGYKVDAWDADEVIQAAKSLRIKLHGQSLSPCGNYFLFDVTPEEWKELMEWMEW